MEEKQCVLRVDEVNSSVTISADESERWSKQAIYRIPTSVTELNKRAYKPQIVSFGPYHHDMEHLRAMEQHKHRALGHFLRRANKNLHSLVEALTPDVQDLKDAYDQLDPKWMLDDNGFLKMLILDGCFILEMLRTTNTEDQPQNSIGQDYASNDPVFSKHGKLYIVPYLKRDMLMLENQIPMKVLEELASIQNNNPLEKDKQVTKLILDFLSQRIPTNKLQELIECKYLHILDVYRKSLLLDEPLPRKHTSKGGPITGRDEIIRSATELNEAGISIQKSKTRSLKDITFSGGVLKLPLIVVDDSLESLYLNMIAYERFHVGAGNEVTSYIFFMDNIIDSAKDVSLLHSCKIIQNALGSDKAVANLFNSLSKDITLDPDNTLSEVHGQVNNYCQKLWPKWRASLWHTYFTNPWAILSVVAAILLFVLTILQTVYTVLSYVRPRT